MRLSKPDEQYEFDWKFYLIAVGFIALLAGSFAAIKRTLNYWEGRDVQALITQSNLASPENWQRQARNYAAPMVRTHGLTDAERQHVEKIYARGFQSWHETWIADRLAGKSESDNRHQSGWMQAHEEVQAYLRSIGKAHGAMWR